MPIAKWEETVSGADRLPDPHAKGWDRVNANGQHIVERRESVRTDSTSLSPTTVGTASGRVISGMAADRGLDRPGGRTRRRARLAQPHRRRLLVDCLEERTLLSTYADFFQLDGDTSATYPNGATGHDWSQVYSDFTKTTSNASGTGAINFYNDPVPVTVPGVTTGPEDT